MSMWKHVAGGLAMGLGQGMVEQAKMTGAMKRDAALAAIRQQERQQDRAWSIEDQQAAAQAAAQASERERTLTLEDRADERAYEAQQAETEFERDQRMARLEASLRAPSNPSASNLYDTVETEDGTLVGIRRDGSIVPLDIKPKSGMKDDDKTAYTREVEYVAQIVAGQEGREEVTDADRRAAIDLRRAASTNTEKAKARDALFAAMSEDRRDRRSIQEKWQDASIMAGYDVDELGPGPDGGSVVTPGGLGGDPGPTEAAAGSPSPAPQGSTEPVVVNGPDEIAQLPSGSLFIAAGDPTQTVRMKP